MKRILKGVLIALGLLAVLLALGGWLLSPRYHVERSTVVDAPPARVWALVADPRRWKDWSAWNRRDPAMRIDYFGNAAGAGAGWAWESKSEGNGRMTFTAADPERRLAFDLAFPDFGTSAHGEIALTPLSGGKTKVDWSLDGDAGRNLFWRWMTLLMDRFAGGDFEVGLANLKSLAEQR